MKPSLEYLHEYPVSEVGKLDDDKGFFIEFSNGAKIFSGEGAIMPESYSGLVGLGLLTTMYDKDTTTVLFGRATEGEIKDKIEVRLNPLEYSIVDPRFKSLERPQSTEIESAPEVEGSREQDGPEAPDEKEAEREKVRVQRERLQAKPLEVALVEGQTVKFVPIYVGETFRARAGDVISGEFVWPKEWPGTRVRLMLVTDADSKPKSSRVKKEIS